MNTIDKKNISKNTIIVYAPSFRINSGGIVILYYLANLINKYFENKINVYVYDYQNRRIKNSIYNNYILKNNIKNNYITIYPEITPGNPLKTQKCVRYILCELGKNVNRNVYKTWNKKDLVFHHSSFNGKNNNNINHFSIIYRNPIFKDLKKQRNKCCFTIRKANKFYNKIKMIHPKNSIHITNQNHKQLFIIFNQCKYFYCYDPYTGLSNIALLCGCIPIIQKINNVNEEEYIRSRSSTQYENIKKLPGYAYGIENLEYAKKTLDEGKKLILKQDERNYENIQNFIKNIYDEKYMNNVEKYYY